MKARMTMMSQAGFYLCSTLPSIVHSLWSAIVCEMKVDDTKAAVKMERHQNAHRSIAHVQDGIDVHYINDGHPSKASLHVVI